MPTQDKEKTNEAVNRQSDLKKLLKEKLEKSIPRIKLRQLLFISVMFVVAFFAIAYIRYMDQPCNIKGAEGFAAAAVEKTLGEGFEDGAVERGQVIQMIYDVLHNLRLESFKEPRDAEAILSWAKSREVLRGRMVGLCEGEPATKQESLVFLARSLGITEDMEELYVEEEPAFSDGTLFDDWTKLAIEGLVILGHLRVSDINELGDLRETITASELEGLLDQVVRIRARDVSFWESTISWLKDKPIWFFITISPSVITVIGFAMQVVEKYKQFIRGLEEKSKRTGTIYLMGMPGTGKTTLKKKMKNPGEPLDTLTGVRELTKECSVERIELHSGNGNVLFEGTVVDGPGNDRGEMLRLLDDPDKKNKILLLVLAHTKKDEGCGQDPEFIKSQLNDIDIFWTNIISGYSEKLNKVVVFINKTDLLSKKDRPAQRHLYKKHIRLLNKKASEVGVTICVAEGNPIERGKLKNLYECLIPASK